MKKLMAVGMLLAMAAGSQAEVISVNFNNHTSTDHMSGQVAGAPGVRVGNWNPWNKDDMTLGDGGQTIIDDSGATVSGFSASLSYNGGWATRNSFGTYTNDHAMYRDVIDAYGNDDSISVSGIPYAEYNLYVYMYDDTDGRAGSFTIGSTTYYARGFGPSEGDGCPDPDGTGYVLSTDTTQGSSTDIDQGNYVVFNGLTSSSFTLDLGAINAGNLDRNKVSGFQIEAIPEPATIGMVGLFGAGLLTFRRFFRM